MVHYLTWPLVSYYWEAMINDWKRLVSLVLLLWVFADLGFQAICCQSDEFIPLAKTESTLAVPQQDQEPKEECAEGGCFCCCTRTLVTQHFGLPLDSPTALGVIPLVHQTPREFEATVYHPPRS